MTTNTNRPDRLAIALVAATIALIIAIVFVGALPIYDVYQLIWLGIVHTFSTAWAWVIGLAQLLGF
jgi:hypothetical protein